MLLSLHRRLSNLRCPDCNTVQPTFPLRVTFKGGFQTFALNDYAVCPSCQARLRLVPRFGLVETLLIQLSLAVVGIVLFLSGIVPLFEMVLTVLGMLGLAILAAFFMAFPFIIAAIMGRIGPLYRKVVQV